MKKFKFKINGSPYEVSVNEIENNIAEIEVNGTPFTVEIEETSKKPVLSTLKKSAGKVNPITTPSRKTVAKAIKAPLPGSIVKVIVKTGQSVKKGDLLMTMESMKMENNILAEQDGIIKNVYVQPGQSVMQDDILVDFEGKEGINTEPEHLDIIEEPKIAIVQKPIAGPSSIKSPLPGSVVKIVVETGQSIKRGDLLMTLESMKMENNILAEKDGIIKKIYVQQGQNIMQDEILFDIE